jgi:hypothetical protein
VSNSGSAGTGGSRWQKAAIVAPVAVVVAAWTASLGSADESQDRSSTDPGIPSVPATSFEDPANYTQPPSLDPESFVTDPNHDSTDPNATAANASTESANGIPTAALTAYQRTEAVLAQADPACHLPWELVGAIGRVESDHGRAGGNVLGDDGKSTPGIFGLPLDGTAGTVLVYDTDGGGYDEDTVYDRAVGPMQFIPSTWEIVGVDADADDIRDPQDIDDAALAAGVYLCAGDNDLATDVGQHAAVFSYNHSDEYVDLVLAIMRSYGAGNFSAVDNGLPSNDDLTVAPTPSHHQPKPGSNKPAGDHDGSSPDGGGNDSSGNHPKPGSSSPGDDDPPTQQPEPTSPLEPAEDTVTNTVDPVVVATRRCTLAFADADIPATPARLQQCIDAYQDGGMAAVNTLVDGLLDTLGGLLGGGGSGGGLVDLGP